jgi:hypothetical protein
MQKAASTTHLLIHVLLSVTAIDILVVHWYHAGDGRPQALYDSTDYHKIRYGGIHHSSTKVHSRLQ